MIDMSDISRLMGATVRDPSDSKIGTVGQIYVDPQGRPVWASVNTGLFGTSQSFVPLDSATTNGDELSVPYEKDFVKDAPRVEDDGTLDPAEEETLYNYYSLDYSSLGTGTDDLGAATGDVDTTGNLDATRRDDDAMTRSEEQLHVGTERVQTGRARLRKYVVTENQNVTVPVTREEVRLEREPITDANVGDALSGPEISEDEHEVTLTEERVVVQKETVPVERVRLDKDTVTEEQQVSEEVRKERIELEEDGTTRGSGSL
jgi:uncharacterized protein (TIGR02271 family)